MQNIERLSWAIVGTMRHPSTIRAYLENVINPAVKSLNFQMIDMKEVKEAWKPFAVRDLEHLTLQTKLAFLLSLQSIWERQFREFLASLIEMSPTPSGNEKNRLTHEKWEQLKTRFKASYNRNFEDFADASKIEELQNWGNFCRHGPGKAEQSLRLLRPDLKMDMTLGAPPMPGKNGAHLANSEQEHFELKIPDSLFEEMTNAIIGFWSEIHKRYNL